MKVKDRPYAGNWSEDFVNKYRKTRSWTPDAIVTFNGETTLPGCPTCRNKIDFSRFITSVSASGGVDGQNSCDISLKIYNYFNCKGCIRLDLIIDSMGPKVLEMNTSPGLTELSDIPAQACSC